MVRTNKSVLPARCSCKSSTTGPRSTRVLQCFRPSLCIRTDVGKYWTSGNVIPDARKYGRSNWYNINVLVIVSTRQVSHSPEIFEPASFSMHPVYDAGSEPDTNLLLLIVVVVLAREDACLTSSSTSDAATRQRDTLSRAVSSS